MRWKNRAATDPSAFNALDPALAAKGYALYRVQPCTSACIRFTRLQRVPQSITLEATLFLFPTTWPANAIARQVMRLDAQRVHRVIRPAHELIIRIIWQKAAFLHPLVKPEEIAQARLQRLRYLLRLPALDVITVHVGPLAELGQQRAF